jgi:hypothetical protein
LISYKKKKNFILFILEVNLLEKIINYIIEKRGIILEGIILMGIILMGIILIGIILIGIILEGDDDSFNGEVFYIFNKKDNLNELRYPFIS